MVSGRVTHATPVKGTVTRDQLPAENSNPIAIRKPKGIKKL